MTEKASLGTVQQAIRQAASEYARREGLRGSAAYAIAKKSGVALRTVQRLLDADVPNGHLANVERVAKALGLAIRIEKV